MSVEALSTESKRRRGRPAVTDVKSADIHFRCTQAQRAEIAAQAERAGISIGAYMLASALKAPPPRSARRPPIERRELARLLGETGKIGSNVNQIARALNRGRDVPLELMIAPVQAELATIRDMLLNALGREV
jgi:hypothetical protein